MSEQVTRLKLEAVGLQTWQKAAQELERMNKSVIPGTAQAFAVLDESGKKLATNITFLDNSFATWGIRVNQLSGGLAVSAKEMTALQVAVGQTGQKFTEIDSALANYNQTLAKAQAETAKLAQISQEYSAGDAIGIAKQGMEELAGETIKLERITKTFDEQNKLVQVTLKGVTGDMEQYTASVRRNKEGLFELVGAKKVVIDLAKEEARLEAENAKRRESNARLVARAENESMRREREKIKEHARLRESIGKTIAIQEKRAAIQAKQQAQEALLASRRIALLNEDMAAQRKAAEFDAYVASGKEKAAQRIAQSHKKISTSGKQLEKDTKSLSQTMTLSYTSIMRLVQVQVLHRIFASLSRYIRDSVQASVEFQKAVAEIQTISFEAKTTTEQWTRELQALSEQFGRPMAEVAEGAYQALSNQVMQSAEDMRFLNEMMKLSAVTVSTLNQAVGAATSIINAFHMEASAANRVSGVLFKSVELGRIRMEEMADSLGRVSMLSAQLGISFEEQQAAFTTLTIQGVKFNVAQTLLANVMLKLVKPSEHMLEIFQRWGVDSGKAAVDTFGFAGVLNKLHQEALKSTDVMSELGDQWGRLRAITGAAGIIFNLEQFEKDTQEMLQSFETYEERFDLIMQSVGKRWDIEMEKMRNVFLRDFGENIIAGVVTVSEAFGGLDKIIRFTMRTFTALGLSILTYVTYTKLLLPATASVANSFKLATALANAFGTSTTFATKTVWGLRLSMMALQPFLIPAIFFAVSYAIVEIASAWRKAQEAIDDYITDLKRNLDIQRQLHEAQWDREVEMSKRKYVEQHRQLLQFIAILRQEYKSAYDAVDKRVIEHIAAMGQAWTQLAAQAKGNLEKVTNELKAAVDAQKELVKIAADLDVDLDLQFAGVEEMAKMAQQAWAQAMEAARQGNVKLYNEQLARLDQYKAALQKHVEELKGIEATAVEQRIAQLEKIDVASITANYRPAIGKLVEQIRVMQIAALKALQEGDEVAFAEQQVRLQEHVDKLEKDFPRVLDRLKITGLTDIVALPEIEKRRQAEAGLEAIVQQRINLLGHEKKLIEEGAKAQEEKALAARRQEAINKSILATEEAKEAFAKSEKETHDERRRLLKEYWDALNQSHHLAKDEDQRLANQLQREMDRTRELLKQLVEKEKLRRAEEELAEAVKKTNEAQEMNTSALEAREEFQKQVNELAGKEAVEAEEFLKKRQLELEAEGRGWASLRITLTKTQREAHEAKIAQRNLELQQAKAMREQVAILQGIAGKTELTTEEAEKAAEATKKLLEYRLEVVEATKAVPEGFDAPQDMSVEQYTRHLKLQIEGLDTKLKGLQDLDTAAGDASGNVKNLSTRIEELAKLHPELAARVKKEIEEKAKVIPITVAHNKAVDGVIKGLDRLARHLDNFPGAKGMQHGGFVHGPGGIDRVPAMLTAGEYVWDKETVKKFMPVIAGLHGRGSGAAAPLTTNYGTTDSKSCCSTSQA